jgi:hypothetical protein
MIRYTKNLSESMMRENLRNGIRLASRLLTLYRRRDVQFKNEDEAQRAAASAKKFLADSFSWQYDSALMVQLRDLLGLAVTDGLDLRWKVQRALETGELVTMPDAIGSGLNGSRGNEMPRPRSVTFTPSQLFKRATDNGSSLRSYTPPRRLWDFPAMDGLAIWAAKPGDVLPDGSIAKAITTTVNPDLTFESVRRSMLGDAQPFEFLPDDLSDEVEQLAASTNSPKFAAKMLGYDQKTFGSMLHKLKPGNGLRPSDNVTFHDDGSVEFNGRMLDDNIHNYAP